METSNLVVISPVHILYAVVFLALIVILFGFLFDCEAVCKVSLWIFFIALGFIFLYMLLALGHGVADWANDKVFVWTWEFW